MIYIELGRSQEVISLWKEKLMNTSLTNWRHHYHDLHIMSKVITGSHVPMEVWTDECISLCFIHLIFRINSLWYSGRIVLMF